EIAVEPNPIRRGDGDALHLSPPTFPLGKARPDLERVAPDYSGGPVFIVLVKEGPVRALFDALEMGEKNGRGASFMSLNTLRLLKKVVDEYFGMHFLLNIERRRLDDEVTPVLIVLPTPNELGIEVRVARVPHFFSSKVLDIENRLVFRRGDV